MTSFQSDANISKLESPLRLRSWAVVCKSGWGRYTGVHASWQSNSTWRELDKNNFFVSSQHLTPENDSREEEEEKKEEHRRHQGRKNWGISLRINLVIVNLVKENLVRVNLVKRQVSPVNVMRTVQRQNKSQVDLNFQTYETRSHVNLSWISWQNVELTYKESLKMYFSVFCALRKKLELLIFPRDPPPRKIRPLELK